MLEGALKPILGWLPALAFAGAAQDPSSAPPAVLDLQANEFTASSQDAAALDLSPDGAGVLVWQSRRQQEGTYGIYARRFLADGRFAGGEVQVNQTTLSHQNEPAVAVDASGAWFAWTSFEQDGDLRGIVARRTGRSLFGGPGEVLVNDNGEASSRAGSQDEVALAGAGDGRAMVAWTTPGAAEPARMVMARRLGPDGATEGGIFAVSQRHDVRDSMPRIAADEAGRFVIVWSRAGADGMPVAILARAFEADGKPRGDEQVLRSCAVAAPIEPSLALERADADHVLVAWLESGADGRQPMLRRMFWDPEHSAFAGAPAFALPTQTPGYTSGLEVALDGERALALWGSIGGSRGADLHLRRVHWNAGEPSFGERVAATAQLDGDQRLRIGAGGRRLHLSPDGMAALAWNGEAGKGDRSAANLTLLGAAPRTEVALEAATPEPVPEQEEEALGASPHEPPTFHPSLVTPPSLLQLATGGGPDFGFVGIVDTGWNPPDAHLAVGPHHLVAVTNGRIAFFQRDGTRLFEQSIEGAGGFFGSTGANGFVFDPEALYDPYSSRFMVCAVERNGGKPYFLFAVSDSFSPLGTWHRYRFDVQAQAGGDNDIDSPAMAVDGDAVYLCADFFGPDKFLVFMLEKAALLAGLQPTTRHLLFTGTQSYGVPVTYPGASAQYMVEASKAPASNLLRLHAISDPLGTPTATTFDLQVPNYTEPEDPPQAGTSSRPDTFDARVWSCVFRGGSLWATHHVGSTHVRQRWYQIAMNGWPLSGTPALQQWGEVDLGPDVRTFFGSLWVDYFGNMGMVFSRSSPNEFITPNRAFRLASDPPGTLQPPEWLHDSTAPELSGRWGDYSAVGVDPAVPGIFWGVGQYRTSSLWSTWIASFGTCLPIQTYCTAKVTSLQTTPMIGWMGEPSISRHSFRLTLDRAVPGQPALFFESQAPEALAFQGGMLCVQPPVMRSEIAHLDAQGSTSAKIRFDPDELGATKYYQFWFRDPQHPDLSATGLSDGLRLTVCP